jgi:outer membrane beta-barrel protein
METRFLGILLVLTGLLAGSATAWGQGAGRAADQVIDPSVERREIRRADIDSENFEVGPYVGMLSIEDFGVNTVVGIKAIFHVTEDIFTEANIGFSRAGTTSYERLSGSSPLLNGSDRDYRYWNINLGLNVLPGEAFLGSNKAFNSSFYLIGGLGTTEFAGDKHFTVNGGFGYQLIMTDAFALRIDVRDHLFELDVLGSKELTNNFEGTIAVTWFF